MDFFWWRRKIRNFDAIFFKHIIVPPTYNGSLFERAHLRALTRRVTFASTMPSKGIVPYDQGSKDTEDTSAFRSITKRDESRALEALSRAKDDIENDLVKKHLGKQVALTAVMYANALTKNSPELNRSFSSAVVKKKSGRRNMKVVGQLGSGKQRARRSSVFSKFNGFTVKKISKEFTGKFRRGEHLRLASDLRKDKDQYIDLRCEFISSAEFAGLERPDRVEFTKSLSDYIRHLDRDEKRDADQKIRNALEQSNAAMSQSQAS